MGKWGRMHREYLKATYPITYTNLILSGKLWTYLADLNEQAQLRLDTLAFGLAATAFCIVYCIAACILVYKLAYKTFRLRN